MARREAAQHSPPHRRKQGGREAAANLDAAHADLVGVSRAGAPLRGRPHEMTPEGWRPRRPTQRVRRGKRVIRSGTESG